MSDEERTPPEIVATPAAVAFIRERGRNLFVWLDDAGLKRVSTERPSADVRFRRIYADRCGFNLYEDEQIGEPVTWDIALRRFPRRHVDAVWNGFGKGGAVVDALPPIP